MAGGAKFLATSRIVQSAATKYKNIGSGIKQAYNISKSKIQKAHQSINNVIIQHPDKVEKARKVLDFTSGVVPGSVPQTPLQTGGASLSEGINFYKGNSQFNILIEKYAD